jgi:hypothetical protein
MSQRLEIEILAKWHRELNTWKWPDNFPFAKPDGFDELPNYMTDGSPSKHEVIRKYMEALEILCPAKEIYRYVQTKEMGKTEVEFEKFWMERMK